MKLYFSVKVSKNTQISNFMKVRSVGAELFHPERRLDGQTDRHDEANIAAFRNFVNATKNMGFLTL
jgi:hypothetical protein